MKREVFAGGVPDDAGAGRPLPQVASRLPLVVAVIAGGATMYSTWTGLSVMANGGYRGEAGGKDIEPRSSRNAVKRNGPSV